MSVVDSTEAVAAFIRRWESSAAAEQANVQSFCNELCDILGPGKGWTRDGYVSASADRHLSHGEQYIGLHVRDELATLRARLASGAS